jgi:hypothetical protein
VREIDLDACLGNDTPLEISVERAMRGLPTLDDSLVVGVDEGFPLRAIELRKKINTFKVFVGVEEVEDGGNEIAIVVIGDLVGVDIGGVLLLLRWRVRVG